jgi:hypothetical protein
MRGQRFAVSVPPMPVLVERWSGGNPAPAGPREARRSIRGGALNRIVASTHGRNIVTSTMKGEAPAQWEGMKALMHVTLPPLGPRSPAFHFAPLVALLEGVIEVNRCHIRQSLNRAAAGLGDPIPPLYSANVPYREDPFGQENWGDVLYCLQCGHADCDRLVLWRCAEVREAGVWVEPVIKWQHLTQQMAISVGYPANEVDPEGVWLVHCCVRWPAVYSSQPAGHPLIEQWRQMVLMRPNGDAIEDPSKELGMGGGFSSHA